MQAELVRKPDVTFEKFLCIKHDPRGWFEKALGLNKNKIEYGDSEIRGRSLISDCELKFENSVKLEEKIEVVETKDFIYLGVIPWDCKDDNIYTCTVDYFYEVIPG